LFHDYYKETGEVLRDSVELVTQIAVLEDSELNKIGIKHLFVDMVEKFNDTYELDKRLSYYTLFSQVIDLCRPLSKKLDEHLSQFDINGEADLVARNKRIRNKKAWNSSDNSEPDKILVLSRVTFGADIAITSLAFAKMQRMFPEAEIVFIAPPLAEPLFAGNPKLKFRSLEYSRKGNLVGRLESWLELLEVVEEEIKTADSYLVIDPDSRLCQVGLLPLTQKDQGYYFYEPSFDQKLLAQDFAQWLDEKFEEKDPEVIYSKLYLQSEDEEKAGQLFEKLKFKKPVIGIHFGTAGEESKQMSLEFEEQLITSLIKEGLQILLYKGAGEKEEERTEKLFEKLKKLSVEVLEVDQSQMASLDTPAPELTVFSRTSLGESAAILGQCQQILCYSSSSKHIAGAQKVPVTVIYIREADFVDRWVPYTDSQVNIVRITPEQKKDEKNCLQWVLEAVKHSSK